MTQYIRMLTIPFVAALLVSVSCTGTQAQTAPAVVADESAQTATVEKKLSPKDVFITVNKALIAGDPATIKKHAAPIIAEDVKAFMKALTPEVGKTMEKYMKNVSAVDGAEFGDLAVIVKYDRGEKFTDGLDTDLICLHKIDGNWKVVLDEGLELAAYFKNAELSESFSKAIKWFKENEPDVRKKLLAETE